MANSLDWDQLAEELERAVKQPISPARRKLLPPVLEEWFRVDLQEHQLFLDSRKPSHERIKKLNGIKKRAADLANSLGRLDTHDREAILGQIIIAEGRRIESVRRTEYSDRREHFKRELQFLLKLSAIRPDQFWPAKRGHPSNLPAYLVLLDAAAIFEWLTGRKAARGVDRSTGAESGPFYRFASTLWPIVFWKGQAGLSAAMKNWARWQSRERSPLIDNIEMRHPTWRLFEP
jgi:hypothetical protein